ncbi:BREX system ATP-binding domain-containing protein [Geodermatophilus sp. SYSU D00779]
MPADIPREDRSLRLPKTMVGRTSAQQALVEGLDAALSSRSSVHLIEGEAGAGKTMLVEWLMVEAAQRSFRQVIVRPVEGEADLPLAAMVDVVRPLARWLPALHPQHNEVLTAAAGGGGRGSTDRLLLGAATLQLIAAAAVEVPVLLVIDDAHWVDAASGEALSFAIRRLLADRVTVVMAQRPTEQQRVRGPWDVISLPGLAECEVGELLATAAGVQPAPSVVVRVREETLGNPLAVSHLANQLSRDALVGNASLPLSLPLQDVARRTFSGLIRALPEATRTALSVVATAGSIAAQFTAHALSELRLCLSDLLPAEEAGLVVVGSGHLDFAHPLYRAAALEVVGSAGVRRAHAALAAAAKDSDPQRHAWHRGLSVVGTDENAAAVLEQAADAAERRVGAAASVGMRKLAVTLSPPGPMRDVRELAAARALRAAGQHAEALSHLQVLLARDGVASEVWAAAFELSARLMLWDTPLDAQPVAQHIPADLPPRQRAATLMVAALRARNMVELQRCRDLSQAAHVTMRALFANREPSITALSGDVEETLFLLPTLSLVAQVDVLGGAHRSASVDELIGRVQRLLAAARGGEEESSAVRAGLVAMLDDLVGSPAQALTWTPALDLADELITLWLSVARARPSSVCYLMLARTELAGWTANLLAGLTAADRAIEGLQELGSLALTGWAHAYAARICAAMGDERRCLEHGAAGTDLGAKLHEPGQSLFAALARGHLLLSTGRAKEATEVLSPAADFMTSMQLHGTRAIPWQPDYVEALARSGRVTQADAALQAWVKSMPAQPDDWHRAVVARCRVVLHGEEGVDELLAAVSTGSLRLTPLEEARAQLVAGTALRRRRRPTAARALIQEAAATFSRVGAAGWRATADIELGNARRSGTTALSGVVDGFGLTQQEMRVAQEIASGATNREAAARLFCSPKTVEYHLTRVYSKLGVRSRSALARQLAVPLVGE